MSFYSAFGFKDEKSLKKYLEITMGILTYDSAKQFRTSLKYLHLLLAPVIPHLPAHMSEIFFHIRLALERNLHTHLFYDSFRFGKYLTENIDQLLTITPENKGEVMVKIKELLLSEEIPELYINKILEGFSSNSNETYDSTILQLKYAQLCCLHLVARGKIEDDPKLTSELIDMVKEDRKEIQEENRIDNLVQEELRRIRSEEERERERERKQNEDAYKFPQASEQDWIDALNKLEKTEDPSLGILEELEKKWADGYGIPRDEITCQATVADAEKKLPDATDGEPKINLMDERTQEKNRIDNLIIQHMKQIPPEESEREEREKILRIFFPETLEQDWKDAINNLTVKDRPTDNDPSLDVPVDLEKKWADAVAYWNKSTTVSDFDKKWADHWNPQDNEKTRQAQEKETQKMKINHDNVTLSDSDSDGGQQHKDA